MVYRVLRVLFFISVMSVIFHFSYEAGYTDGYNEAMQWWIDKKATFYEDVIVFEELEV